MDIVERIIEYYERPNFRVPFTEWFYSLKSKNDQSAIRSRLARLRAGNLGDCKPIGEGVFELRIHVGPGYRIYFGQAGMKIVVLLIGGEKSTQNKDIPIAQAYWMEFRRRQL